MMKKCTTLESSSKPSWALKSILGLAAAVSMISAQAQVSGAAVTDAQPVLKSGNRIELAKDAPDRHTVVRGDTLWDISGKFLATPWKWPEVWQMNREQIKNPHLIYPGEIVYLDRSGSSPRLRLGKALNVGAAGEGTAIGPAKLEPLVRSEPIDRLPIPTISSQAIEAFLNRPLVVEENELTKSPRVVGGSDARLYLGKGDRVYARGFSGNPAAGTDWHIYRPAKPILDPETRKPIAYEAIYVGAAKFERSGDPATMRITGNQEEVGEGDRLIQAEPARTFNYSPKAPDQPVMGRIVSIYKGVSQAGKNNVITLSVGKSHGVDVGTVLVIQQPGREITDRQVNQKIRLPDEPVGHVLVFRTFDKISYGLIVEATGYPTIGDKVTNP
jgi:LysM domain